MNPELLEQVLACKCLPSLPAVAMRVVELTNSDKVSMREMGDVIQHDQALAAKVLRTVNSSMYGLRSRCSSINQAIVMLGLSAVKTLALGFTLVGAIKDSDTGQFDLEDYWRRGLYTGIAARALALKAGLSNPEEAFLGGLLQDVGMLALYQTLGLPYLGIVAGAEGDHRKVAKVEMEALETQHADVGAMLASRWKLPQSLVMPIKYHERATAAPLEYSGVCRAVGIGNIAAEILTTEEPADALRRFYQRAEMWFSLTPLQADEVLKVISAQTREVAKLLTVKTGAIPDAAEVIAKARQQLEQITPTDDTDELNGGDDAGANGEMRLADELTGVANRARLDQALVGAFEQARHGVGVLTLAVFEIDGHADVVKQFGEDAGDTVLIAVANRLQRAFKPIGGLVARYGPAQFAVVVPKCERAAVAKACELVRAAIATEPLRLIAAAHGAPPSLTVTCSVGVASVDRTNAERIDDVQGLTGIAEQALGAAVKAGRNSVRVYAPAVAR